MAYVTKATTSGGRNGRAVLEGGVLGLAMGFPKELGGAGGWGGIHFRTADVQGVVMGRKVAFWLQKHYFKPTKKK